MSASQGGVAHRVRYEIYEKEEAEAQTELPRSRTLPYPPGAVHDVRRARGLLPPGTPRRSRGEWRQDG